MRLLTRYENPEEMIDSSYGRVTIKDWMIEEIKRIQSHGGMAGIREGRGNDHGGIALVVTVLAPWVKLEEESDGPEYSKVVIDL